MTTERFDIFDHIEHGAIMMPAPDGHYVTFSDFDALRRERDGLLSAAIEYAKFQPSEGSQYRHAAWRNLLTVIAAIKASDGGAVTDAH